jgi:Fe-S-cluster containining protein
MQNGISSETCKTCGECCKHFPFVELSQNEVDALETFTGLSSDLFTNPITKAGGGYFLQFKENGDCVFLDENGDQHSCSVYEARSGKCRSYPSTPSQNEVCNANKAMCLKKTAG